MKLNYGYYEDEYSENYDDDDMFEDESFDGEDTELLREGFSIDKDMDDELFEEDEEFDMDDDSGFDMEEMDAFLDSLDMEDDLED